MIPSRPATPLEPGPAEKARFRLGMQLTSGLAPLLLAVLGGRAMADAAHDEGAVRVLGLGFTGAFRALDAWVAAPFLLLPAGTRASRAALACAAVTGLSGLLAFHLGEPLVQREGERRSRLALAVTAIGALTMTCAPPWQLEGSAVGGSVIGAALVLLAALLGTRVQSTPAPLALVVGAASAYEPLLGLMALSAGLVPGLVTRGSRSLGDAGGAATLRVVGAFALGLLPLVLAFVSARGGQELGVSAPPLASPGGEGVQGGPLARDFFREEVGWLFAAAAGVGLVMALRERALRARAAGLLVLVSGLPLSFVLGLPHGPTRYGAPLLVGLAGLGAFATLGLHALVLRVRSARIPFAPASASLLVVLEWTLPVRAADDSLTRHDARPEGGPRAFVEAALGGAPPTAIVLVNNPRLLTRFQAARAQGQLREDIELFPTFDIRSPLARGAVEREPKLAGFYRDLALGTLPEEWSLSSLAAARPLLVTFDPRWNRGLARHLVPTGLYARFEAEPQGASDRRLALSRLGKRHAELLRDVTGPGKDTELQHLVAHLLRARAIAMGATGERENLSRALEDLAPFAPDDPVAALLVRRSVASKGIIPVEDLTP